MPIDINYENISRIPRDLFVKLQSVYDTLKTAERKAADLLLQSPEFFSGATIVEAAERAGCSEATLTRLAKKLGYGGYPELKNHLSSEKENQNSLQLYGNITETDNCHSVVAKVFEASIQALSDTLNVLDMDQYNLAVQYLCRADKIVFLGVGDAATVALSGYQKFIRLGLNVHASPDPDVQLLHVSHLTQEDVVIAVSHSGRTKSTLEAIKLAKAGGAKIISITNFPVSPISKNSDIVLLTAAFTQHFKGEVMAKRVTELCIIESLFVNMLLNHSLNLSEGLGRSNEALEINKL